MLILPVLLVQMQIFCNFAPPSIEQFYISFNINTTMKKTTKLFWLVALPMMLGLSACTDKDSVAEGGG